MRSLKKDIDDHIPDFFIERCPSWRAGNIGSQLFIEPARLVSLLLIRNFKKLDLLDMADFAHKGAIDSDKIHRSISFAKGGL